MNYVCGYMYLFLQFKDGHEFHQINPIKCLMYAQYLHIRTSFERNTLSSLIEKASEYFKLFARDLMYHSSSIW